VLTICHRRGRSLVRPEVAADLVALDAATVNDRATYAGPEQPPIGLPRVLVNSVFAVRDGPYTGARRFGARVRSSPGSSPLRASAGNATDRCATILRSDDPPRRQGSGTG
jgi:N-acyl-D-aspartate/D-glutamate deacylase